MNETKMSGDKEIIEGTVIDPVEDNMKLMVVDSEYNDLLYDLLIKFENRKVRITVEAS